MDNTHTTRNRPINHSHQVITQALNTKQASTYTGLAPATLEKMRCTGGGPRFVSYSRRAIRYRMSDLDIWMSSKTISSTSERAAA